VLTRLDDVRAAARRIRGVAVRTPLLPCAWDATLRLKPESLQPIGAFKIRGAYNAMAGLDAEQRRRGVVTHSSGNHAQAVAYAGRLLDIRVVVVMPDAAPTVKVEATRALGAEVVVVPAGERLSRAEALVAGQGYVMVPPFDHPAVIAGQGTVGLEIAEDMPDVGTVLVPVSGGGLISGVAAAVKALVPSARVVGVEPELAADAQESLRTGRVVEWDVARTSRTAADGLRVPRVGVLPWEHLQALVDDIVTVSEEEIRAAVRLLAVRARLVAEPSGAVTTAAHLFRDGLPPGPRVAVVSGGNIEPAALAEILAA
jgi:threonine dehydratase